MACPTRSSRFLTFTVIIVLAASGAASSQEAQKTTKEQAEINWVRVNITTERRGTSDSVEIDGKRIPNYSPTIIQVFPSTGIVMDEKGNILTFLGYRWVEVQSPNPRIEVFTGEGQKYQGKLVGIDQSIGVAVVRAQEAKLKKTPVCQHCEILDGATIMTPVVDGVEFQEFKTAQILSIGSLANASQQQGSLVVTINQPLPGVGEPIFNTDHRVLGFIASQKPSREDPAGVSTVVYPISQLLNSAQKILKVEGDVQTGWLGVYVTGMRSPLGKGVEIREIEEDSPAQRAGLIPKDILLKWNGKEILDAGQFIQIVQNTSIGSRVKLDLLRENKPLSLSALIEARKTAEGPGKVFFNFPGSISLPAQNETPGLNADVSIPRIGIETVELTPQFADFLAMPGQTGLLVVNVNDGTSAGRAGLMVGDVITSVDGEKILNPSVFASHIRSRGWGGRLALRLIRKGIERRAVIFLPHAPSSPKQKK